MSVPENGLSVPAADSAASTVVPTVPMGTELASAPSPLPPAAIVQLIVINALWGASSAATKTGLSAFGPFTLIILRFLPAGLILLWLAKRQKLCVPIRRADRLPLFVLALVGIALTYGIFYIGIAQTTATDASLLFACEPLLLALMAALFLRERLRPLQWTGLLAGMGGIWILAGNGLGNRIALLGLACECSTGVIAKSLTERYSGRLVVAWNVLFGALLVLPLAVWEIAQHPPTPAPAALAAAAYLSLVNTVFCYGIWYRLMERYPLSLMGAFILVQPLCGPIFGWLLQHETLKPASALGGALVIAGITLTTLVRSNPVHPEKSC